MTRPPETDVERALTSLGANPIGYRRFPSKIDLPDPIKADFPGSTSAEDREAVLFPLLMAVFPDAPFAGIQSIAPHDVSEELVMESSELATVKTHLVDLDIKAGSTPGKAINMEPMRQHVSLAYMFEVLRAGNPMTEMTMSQLQAAFKKL